MTQADDRILEFYDETGIGAPPAVVAWNIEMSDTHVKRRISKLVDESLLVRVDDDRGYYEITKRGRSYLSGEIESTELER